MKERCDAIVTIYRPFIMGGRVNQASQCRNDAKHIVREKSSGDEMSLCADCLGEFWKANEGDELLYVVSASTPDTEGGK